MINRHNLAVHAFASDEESRGSLASVQFTPSETIATNGHYMVRVTNVPSETVQTTTRPFLLSAKDLKAIRVKKGDAVELASNGSETSWNLTTGTSTYHLTETSGQFPNVDVIMPKDEPKLKLGLSPSYLAKLAKAFASFLDEDRQPIIEVSLYSADKSIQMKATNSDGQTMTALLMPMRLK